MYNSGWGYSGIFLPSATKWREYTIKQIQSSAGKFNFFQFFIKKINLENIANTARQKSLKLKWKGNIGLLVHVSCATDFPSSILF